MYVPLSILQEVVCLAVLPAQIEESKIDYMQFWRKVEELLESQPPLRHQCYFNNIFTNEFTTSSIVRS